MNLQERKDYAKQTCIIELQSQYKQHRDNNETYSFEYSDIYYIDGKEHDVTCSCEMKSDGEFLKVHIITTDSETGGKEEDDKTFKAKFNN